MFPFVDPLAFAQLLFTVSPKTAPAKLISCMYMPSQGALSLQSNAMAIFDALVPLMFLYTTLLIFTAEP